MNKLVYVRKALCENGNITIVRVRERNYLPGEYGSWSHTVDFYVAPISGVYVVEDLQALLLSLVPVLEPTQKDSFCELRDEITFGKLYFDESIGTKTVRHEITLTDEEMFSSDGFVDGKQVIERTEKIKRRTWVSLFPNIQIATAALKGENEFRIPKKELAKYRGFIARLSGALS